MKKLAAAIIAVAILTYAYSVIRAAIIAVESAQTIQPRTLSF